MKKLNLIDGTNIFYICWSVYRQKLEKAGLKVVEDSYGEMLNIFFMKIKQFFDVPNVVVAFEGKDSRKWRKDVYPEYKGTRPTSEDDPTLIHIKPLMNLIIDILELMPVKVMKIDNCEADDVIFTLANSAYKAANGDIQITIISSDEDMTQIPLRLDINKVRVYHPCTKKYRECNPQIVIQKILSGDVSDNIKFKKGLGGKTALKLAEGDMHLYKRFITSKEDCDRLMTIAHIVDSRYFPLSLRQEIVDTARKLGWNNNSLQQEENEEFIRNKLNEYSATYCLGFLSRVLPALYRRPNDPINIFEWADAENYDLPKNIYELFQDEYMLKETEEHRQNLLGLKKEMEYSGLL